MLGWMGAQVTSALRCARQVMGILKPLTSMPSQQKDPLGERIAFFGAKGVTSIGDVARQHSLSRSEIVKRDSPLST